MSRRPGVALFGMHLRSILCLSTALSAIVLPEGLLAQLSPQGPNAAPPDDGIVVRWSGRDPISVYAGNIGWTVVIATRMRNSFRVTGKPGPNTIVVRDADGQMVPPSPVRPVYTLRSGNVHSHFVNASLMSFTLDGLGFYLAPGRYSIEVVHRNDQDPPKGSTHSFPPFKGELVSPPFHFEALPHPDPGWGKSVSGLELTITSRSAEIGKGDRIELRGTIRNTGTEPQTLPDTHWEYIARAYLDDPKGGRFIEQKGADVRGMGWKSMPLLVKPGEAYPFTYSTERFDFRNKTFGGTGDEMGVYLGIPLATTGGERKRFLYSNKVHIRIHGRLP